MTAVSIAGLDKAKVLSALYNASRQQGMGFLHTRGAATMTPEEAEQEIEKHGLYFDYLHGRVLKVDLSGDVVDTWGYDRDLGDGALARVIGTLYNT